MSKPTIYFITTNEFKFNSFTEAINLDGYQFERLAIETPEIQAGNNQSIAEFSAKWAANAHKLPVITEDVGLYVHALKGFPGPFLAQAEKQLGVEGFLALLDGVKDREAYWEYAVAYCEPDKEPVSFRAVQKGSIAEREKGTVGWPVGKIFIQENQTDTVSVQVENNSYVRDNSHYAQLREYLAARV